MENIISTSSNLTTEKTFNGTVWRPSNLELNEDKIKTKTIRTIKNLEDTFEYSKVLVYNELNTTLSHSLFTLVIYYYLSDKNIL